MGGNGTKRKEEEVEEGGGGVGWEDFKKFQEGREGRKEGAVDQVLAT